MIQFLSMDHQLIDLNFVPNFFLKKRESNEGKWKNKIRRKFQ